MSPHLIPGATHTDPRGTLRFCNAFDMTEVKRFYTIRNSPAQPKRGWIMHKRETKWFFPLTGITTIHVEAEDNSNGSFRLDATCPSVLKVPPLNWFLIEQDGTAELQVFSNCAVGEFKDDDFRR